MSTLEFDKELKETCGLGDKIIDNQKFKDIEKILDDVEERRKSEELNQVKSRTTS
ncbi:MAG: hypothetical protein RLZZ347_440 [Candidatus Parcubacteria bacterium]|jgi:hypothetical protein